MAKKKVDKQFVPRIDDPTAAFPIGVLAGLSDQHDDSDEGTDPQPAPTPEPARKTAPTRSSIQVGWLVLSLFAGAGLAAFVALLLGVVLLLR